jgi:hypothetical protein
VSKVPSGSVTVTARDGPGNLRGRPGRRPRAVATVELIEEISAGIVWRVGARALLSINK